MNIKDIISENYKQRGFLKITSTVLENPELINELFKIILEETEYPYPEYSSWLLFNVFKKVPQYAKIHSNSIVDIILIINNAAVLRNMIASSILTILDEYREGELMDKLIFCLKDSKSKPALIVNSIYKLIQFTHKYPDIKYEILNIIEIVEQQNISPSVKVGIKKYKKLFVNEVDYF